MTLAPPRDRNLAAAALAIALTVAVAASVVTAHWIYRDGNFAAAPPADPATVFGDLLAYWAATLAVMALYLALVLVVRRGLGRRAGFVLVGSAFVVQLALVLSPPVFSTDVLSYVAHGAIGHLGNGANAYATHGSALVDTDIGRELLARGWLVPAGPSPYGGLWSAIEVAIDALGPDVWSRMVAFRLVAIAACAVSAWAIWSILGRVRPAARLTGVVLFAWNPIVIFELAMEGHNDALMAALALLAVAAAVAGRPATSMFALGAGALVKYVPLALAPALVVYQWRVAAPDERPRVAGRIALGTVGAAVLAIVAFAPFWTPDLLEGVSVSATDGAAPSFPGLLAYLVSGFSFEALRPIGLGAAILFGIAVLVLSAGVRDAGTLFRTAAATSLLFALAISPVFYPWYLALPIALLALMPTLRVIVLIAVLTIVGRVAAPLTDIPAELRPFPYADWVVSLVGIAIAGVVALWAGRERAEPTTP